MPRPETLSFNWRECLKLHDDCKITLSPQEYKYVELRASGLSYNETRKKMELSRRRLWDIQVSSYIKYSNYAIETQIKKERERYAAHEE